MLDFKSFRGKTSKNVQDIQKLVFRCASVSLYYCLDFMSCLKSNNSRDDPSILIDMLSVKTFGYDSLRATLRAPRGTLTLDKVAVQDSVHHQERELPPVVLLKLNVPVSRAPNTHPTASNLIWGNIRGCLRDVQLLS